MENWIYTQRSLQKVQKGLQKQGIQKSLWLQHHNHDCPNCIDDLEHLSLVTFALTIVLLSPLLFCSCSMCNVDGII